MKYLIILLMLLAVPCYAQTYVKVDENTIRAIETKETSIDLTVEEIKHELDGVRKDMENITASYNRQMDTFIAIEEKYESMLSNCEELGIKEKVTPGDLTIVTEGTK